MQNEHRKQILREFICPVRKSGTGERYRFYGGVKMGNIYFRNQRKIKIL